MDDLIPDQWKSAIGHSPKYSQWLVVRQEMINQFAEATDDRQFIHTDPVRAAKETPFGGTIAHGFLLISLFPSFASEVLPHLDGAIGINYGFDKVRFLAPVKSGNRIRAKFSPISLDMRAPSQFISKYEVTIEEENSTKPVLVANWLMLMMMLRH